MLDRKKKKLNGNGENQARSEATLLENGAANWYCGFPSFSPYSPSGAAFSLLSCELRSSLPH